MACWDQITDVMPAEDSVIPAFEAVGRVILGLITGKGKVVSAGHYYSWRKM